MNDSEHNFPEHIYVLEVIDYYRPIIPIQIFLNKDDAYLKRDEFTKKDGDRNTYIIRKFERDDGGPYFVSVDRHGKPMFFFYTEEEARNDLRELYGEDSDEGFVVGYKLCRPEINEK